MDTNKMRPISDAKSNTEANNWKSKEHRNAMIKKIADFLIKRGNPSWTQNLPVLMQSIERFEKDVFDSANNEAEYTATISTKIKAIRIPYQSDESNIVPSNVFGSGLETPAIIEWQEHMYEKLQTVRNKNFPKLNSLYNGLCKRLQQNDKSVSQQPKISSIVKCKQHTHALERIFEIFKVSKSQITPDFEQKLDKVEKYIHSIEQSKYVSSHSKVSQGEEMSTKKPTSQLMGEHSSHFTEQDFTQMAIQFSNSHSWPNLVSDKQGCENVVRQQTSGEIASPIINNSQILASPLVESCNDQGKESSEDHIDITDHSSPEMQNLLKLLSSVSVETLMASCGDIGMLVHLTDNMPLVEPLIGPPIGSIDSDLEGVFVTDSQAGYLSHGEFVQRERKLNHFINSMSTSDTFVHLTSAEKSFSNSKINQENNDISQEIKEINKRLMDTEVVVDRLLIAGRDGKEFIVKLCFNSMTINPNPMSKYTIPYKKFIIEPLWVRIPTSYPHCSVVILDEMSSDASKDQDELSVKAKLKLRVSLLKMSEPLLLKDVATLWDHCAREAIREHAELLGGGTFTSKYGGWETILDDDDDAS